ncbi:MAG: DegT/DnrJ/EryC1/StrS family aminotransferase [Gammaproteobacteria bacterium]|nr:DegT/DnrJ/EryC1/StrS family aminotransferase [Gammaproteobacteria bacterium]
MLREVGGLVPPKRQPWCDRHAYHLYICRYQPDAFGGRSRADFIKAMNAEGIPCGVGYAKLLSEQDGMRAVATNRPDRIRVTDSPNTRAIVSDTVWLSQQMLLADREVDGLHRRGGGLDPEGVGRLGFLVTGTVYSISPRRGGEISILSP